MYFGTEMYCIRQIFGSKGQNSRSQWKKICWRQWYTVLDVLSSYMQLLFVGGLLINDKTASVGCTCGCICFITFLLLSWRARQALPIRGDKDVPKRWEIPPDSESGGIRLSLVVVDSHLLTGAPLKGGCRCPQLTYCRPLSNGRCWRMSTNSQAAVGSPTL